MSLFKTVHDEVDVLLREATRFVREDQGSAEPLHEQGGVPTSSKLADLLSDVQQLCRRGSPVSLSDIPAFYDLVRHTNSLDDRKFLLEKLIVFMSRLPNGSKLGTELQTIFISLLYNDLPHPPSGYLAVPTDTNVLPTTQTNAGVTYAYRPADGTLYNPLYPTLGKAGSPYARSVPSTRTLPRSVLPDAGLVFDTLLRRDKFEAHPGGMSSLFFAFANLVIHSLFNTDAGNKNINNSSSYLDLSPLYGNNDDALKTVRRFDGSGKLWNDCFADVRILDMPPSSGALLVLFNRNHNYVADRILSLNENGNLLPLSTLKSKGPAGVQSQDEELFQRARLVNCAYFVQVIFGDYVGAILGLVRDNRPWRLNALEPAREINHEWSPRGDGNVVSTEFNFMYRWHATLSEQDTKWTENTFNKLFEGKPYDEITIQEFMTTLKKYLKAPGEPKEWVIAGLTRGPDGRFKDDDLAKVMLDATAAPAAAYKARGTPDVLRIVEILGIEQARRTGVCTLNEFRKFMGLKEYASFKDWNPDPEIYNAAERLYTHIDNLELHVGLQAEEAKKPMPGAGLCPGYTISRAILGDAICLTRGDRFLTTEFTPYNLTAWGYNDCQFQPDDGSFGGMLTKLLYRALPEQYDAKSAWAHFPFLVPDTMKKYWSEHTEGLVEKYNFDRPAAPVRAVVLSTYDEVLAAAEDTNLVSDYRGRLLDLVQADPAHGKVVGDALSEPDVVKRLSAYVLKDTKVLIDDRSIDAIKGPTKSVDIVKHVINRVPVYLFSTQIASLPLKTDASPRGSLREQELVSLFADVCNYIFIDADPYEEWALRQKAKDAKDKLVGYTRDHIKHQAFGIASVAATVTDTLVHLGTGEIDESGPFIQELFKKMKAASLPEDSIDQLADAIFGEVIATAASFSLAVTHIVDYYLDASRQPTMAELAKACIAFDDVSNAKILEFAYTALRHNPPVSAAAYSVLESTELLSAGQRVVCDLVQAYASAPTDKIDLRTLGVGRSGLFNSALFEVLVPSILRPIFSLEGVRRGPNLSGQLTSFEQARDFGETADGRRVNVQETLYLDTDGRVTPFPASLIIQYGPSSSPAPTTNGTTNGHVVNGTNATTTNSTASGRSAKRLSILPNGRPRTPNGLPTGPRTPKAISEANSDAPSRSPSFMRRLLNRSRDLSGFTDRHRTSMDH